MKASRNPFLILLLALPLSSFPALADTYQWSGPTGGSWTDPANWDPATGTPGSGDFATFTLGTGSTTINLNGDQSVLGLQTPGGGNTSIHTLLGGGTNRTLTIGTSGIEHLSGGITIGSTTDGQKVNVILSGSQTWNSSRSSGASQAIFVNNAVSLAGGLGEQTLTLTGANTGSFIRETISEGAGSTLNLRKTGTGVWQLNSDNTYTGTTTIEQGILRILSGASIDPTKTTVHGGAALAIRLDGTGNNGLDNAEIEHVLANTTFSGGPATPSIVQFDHAGTQTYSGDLTGGYRLQKVGNGTLALSGTGAPAYGTEISTGRILLLQPGALSGDITVTNDTSIVLRAGGTGFSASEIETFRNGSNLTINTNGYFGIDTGNGDFLYDRVLPAAATGTTRFVKTGTNTLILTEQNTYNGATRIENGTLSISDIKNGGLDSQIGRASNVANGIMLAGGRLQYTGSGSTTDRLFNLTASSVIESSGTGALVFTNTGASTASGDANRTFRLTGYNRDANRMNVAIIDGTTTDRTTGVIKSGFGSWTLNGDNTYTGATTVRGGTLTLDYSNGRTPVFYDATNGSEVTAQHGTVHFTGAPSAQIRSLRVSETDNGHATIKISGGMTLTADHFTGTGHSQRHVFIDLLGADNKLIATDIGPSVGLHGSLIMSNNSTRANIVVRDNAGAYGFAAYDSDTREINRLTGQTALAEGAVTINSNSTNYLLTAGNYSTAATVTSQTMTLDSSAGVINFTFNSGHNINGNSNGRAWLFTGSHDINLTGSGGAIANSTWFHNYLPDDATLNISSSFGNSNWMIISGPGFTNYTGTGLATSSNTHNFVLNGGVFRYSPAAADNLPGVYRLSNGIFEVGGNLSGGGANDIEQTSSNFRLYGDSGFSAFGGDRKVSLGTNLTWGSANFLVDTSNFDGDHAFRLSSTRSDSTVDFVTHIDLNGKMRTIDVTGGGADIDARVSGDLTGEGIANRLVKSGAGTLELTGTNTYAGLTRVDEGRLMVGGGGLTTTTDIHVRNNATLELSAGHHGDLINDLADITLENARLVTNSHQETMGRLILVGDNTIDLVGLGNIIHMADSSDVAWGSTLTILNWNGGLDGGGDDQFYVGTDENGVTSSQLSNISFYDPTVDGILYAGTFDASITTLGEIIPVIPEPSTSLLLLGTAGTFLLRRRRVA